MTQQQQGTASPFSSPAWLKAWQDSVQHLRLQWDMEQVARLQQDYVQAVQDLWQRNWSTPASAAAAAPFTDRRFAHEAWRSQPLAAFTVAAYDLQARTLSALAQCARGDEKTCARLRFAVEQWIAACAPSNFLATNAEALHKAMQTQGQSLQAGMDNLLRDVQQRHISMTDERQFAVGKNLAVTPGAVIFENDYLQLLEYKPQTPKVQATPLLLVPAFINKYYILDLQPHNSLANYCVQQGIHTFMVSWRNPVDALQNATWDDYVERALMAAMEALTHISPTGKMHVLGFCIGGTLLATTLATLAARKKAWVQSATFLTTLLDFEHTGTLQLFVDEASVLLREAQMGQGGLMPGNELAAAFSFLRPNELVWNYVAGNYLKGETPAPFDLLYWNADSTHAPGPLYAWYLRKTYLENAFIQKAAVSVAGHPLDLQRITVPCYFYASREDHIVPLQGAYQSMLHINAPKRFVVGASGHIAGVINPASGNKRCHWVSSQKARSARAKAPVAWPAQAEDWLAQAQEKPGSWWPDWMAWLKAQADHTVAAPKRYGGGRYQVLEAAPGSYVKVRI